MAAPAAVLALLFELAIVAVALAGVVRLAGLRALSDDPRLRRLSWFFGLFAAAVGVQALVSVALLGHNGSLGTPILRLARLNLLQHGLMLAALAVGLRAFATPWKPSAVASAPAAAVMLVGRMGLLGLVEAVLALYLAVASVVNQRRRRTGGSLRVAVGFLLFFLGHLSFWVFQKTGAVRPFWAEALTLASIVLLVASVPRLRPRHAMEPDPTEGAA